METGKIERLSRGQLEAEIEALNQFLTFAGELSESLHNRRKFRFSDCQRNALRLTYNRLERESRRRAQGGRPLELTDETVAEIADKIERRGKKIIVKTGGTIEDLCRQHGATYKSFWRRWNKKGREKSYSLAETLAQIEILLRLANGEIVRGKRDRLKLEKTVRLARELPARIKARKTKGKAKTTA